MAKTKKITFIDLFAGIGGFHIAFVNLGAECVWACEWDKFARMTYEENFKSEHPELFKDGNFAGDITKVDPESIPDFDILTAGFPCQPFSQAGKKMGFEEIRGTLFFNIAEILRVKRPKAFFLENVRHLRNHDGGRTFATMKRIIEELGYSFKADIVKASDFGLPTHRPRLFMVGFLNQDIPFKFPDKQRLTLTMSDIFGGECDRIIGYTLRVGGKSSGMDDRRNWDAYLVDGKVRIISVPEAKKLMGFPDEFVFPVSNTQAMKQLGNSVAVSAVQATAAKVIEALKKYDK
ncbi:MAG: DNA (cytosine-5-)-methyltransferase [Microgenomates group bacterium Gr01-1014_7]|nr:MAG: DNA (cytosine-5-)-methyltransferase [Microgenomates group bacterium Gr01-1014_7]